jgi:small-conductance mechanosensitive channel
MIRLLRSVVLCSAVLLAASLPLTAQQPTRGGGTPAAQAAPAAVEPATLTVWQRPIAVFRVPFGYLSPRERVTSAAARIAAMPEGSWLGEVKAERTKLADLDGMVVSVDSRPAFGIMQGDLDPLNGETLEQASAEAAGRLRALLRARHDQRSVPVLLRGIGLSLAAGLALALVIWLVLFLRRVAARVVERPGYHAGLKLFEIDFSTHAISLERRLLGIMSGAVVLIGSYLWLTFVLSQFPYSQPWAHALASYLLAVVTRLAGGAVSALPGLATVGIIFLITRTVARLASGLFREVELERLTLPGFHPETARATRQVVVTIVWLFALTVAYPYIPGSRTDAFKGVSLFAGLLFSLGSAGLLSQLMGGLVITYSRALRPGEFVRIGEIEGVVSELGVLCTKIVTWKKEEIAIPNAVLVAATTTNLSRHAGAGGALLATSVTIGYDAPWRQVDALLMMAAERTAGVRRQPLPRVVQKALSDFCVEYVLLVHVERADQRMAVMSELHSQIQDAFNDAGVQIMSPHFEAQPERPVVAPRGSYGTPPSWRSNGPDVVPREVVPLADGVTASSGLSGR